MRNAFAILAGSIALVAASSSNAAVLFDSGGFEGYNTGTVIGQNGWERFNGSDSQYTIASNTSGKYLAMTGAGASGTSYGFPLVEYTPVPGSGELVSVNVDLAASDPNLSNPDNTGFYVDMYSDTARIGRFGFSISANTIKIAVVSWFNPSTGQFAPAAAATVTNGLGIYNVTASAALTANTFYNLEARINFDAKTWDLYNNGTLFLGGLAFADVTSVNATQVTLSDADASVVSGAAGSSNTGFLDNYLISTIPAAVPEPTALAAIAPAGLLLSRRRRA